MADDATQARGPGTAPPEPGSSETSFPGQSSAKAPGGIAHEVGDLHRLLVESVEDYAIFALDPNGYILSWNAGAERFKGYKAHEIIGKHFSIFYPAEKIEEGFPDEELRVAAKVGRFEDEGWRIRKDGTRFWANVVITALHDPSGRLVGYAKVTRDLTERMLAEEALRESEERFRLLVQGVKDYAIFMLDPRGRVATWNDGAARIKGYTAAEIVGKHFSIFYPKAEVEAHKPEHELKVATATGVFQEEGWRVRKDGSLFWASVVLTAIRNGDRLVGFAKVTRDLTERRAAQERALADARLVAAEEAARHAAEAREQEFRALAEQLRHRSEELDIANRAKAQFLAAMSHELRTPLNAIGGYAELLEMGIAGPVTEQQREHLERIQRSQQHLLGIINDILNFSRIEAGQISYNIAPLSLCDVIDSVSHMIAPQAKAKGVRIEKPVNPVPVMALADNAKVEQIALNLISNAVKFTDTGGTISLSCEARGDRVRIAVRDTGSGIAADQLEAIFEPFVQVGRTLTSMREGTGLGLAISRDLARAMGGDITVESALDSGSTFTVSLPRATEVERQAGP